MLCEHKRLSEPNIKIDVDLSNICYTISDKFSQDSLRRFPTQRTHRKLVIVPAIIDLELFGKVLEGIKRMRSVKPFIIFAMAAFYFPVVVGVNGRISLCWIPYSFNICWNKVNVSLPQVEKRLVNSFPLSV